MQITHNAKVTACFAPTLNLHADDVIIVAGYSDLNLILKNTSTLQNGVIKGAT